VERELVDGGFVLRYRTADTGDVDGLTGREGAFLACSFWLADCLSMLGRDRDARQLLDRLLGLRNDLGLLSEEYDPVAGRLVGNFPQAFSHVSLVNSASKLTGQEKPSTDHVMLGLAQRSTRTMAGTTERHLGGATARSIISKLVDTAGSTAPRGAARAIQAALTPGGTAGAPNMGAAPVDGRPPVRPTTEPSVKKATALGTKPPTKRATKATAKKAATTKRTAKKATAKKATAKRSSGRADPRAGGPAGSGDS
jgi:hypothetical protein